MLQEKLQAAEARAEAAEKALKDTAELQNEVARLRVQSQDWESSARNFGLDSPGELYQKLEDLRSQYLAATAQVGEKDAELRQAQGVPSYMSTVRRRSLLMSPLYRKLHGLVGVLRGSGTYLHILCAF